MKQKLFERTKKEGKSCLMNERNPKPPVVPLHTWRESQDCSRPIWTTIRGALAIHLTCPNFALNSTRCQIARQGPHLTLKTSDGDQQQVGWGTRLVNCPSRYIYHWLFVLIIPTERRVQQSSTMLPAWSHSPIFCGLRGTPEQLKYQDMISKSISKSLEDYSDFFFSKIMIRL